MMLTLSKQEMAARWLALTRLEPLRADCNVTRSYGIDLEAVALAEARIWYLTLLANGPLRWLRITEMADNATLAISDEGILTVTLPEKCVRPVDVTLHGWERPAVVTPHDSPLARLQTNPFSCGGVARPVAVEHPGRRLEIHSAPERATARLKSLRCVVDPGPETYVFHEEALATVQPLDGRPQRRFNVRDFQPDS